MSLGVCLRDTCPYCGRGDEVGVTEGITYNIMPIFEPLAGSTAITTTTRVR